MLKPAAKFLVLTLFFVTVSSWSGSAASAQDKSIVCASTTSTLGTGLFEYLLPKFKSKTGISVKVVAVGTGQAIKMAAKGDADVLFVHSKPDELKFVSDGFGVKRDDVMYNDFIMLGPESDPAGIKGGLDAVKAFASIYAKKATFVSRGDDSGTNKMELSLWKKAGLTPKGQPWYLESGQGMNNTMLMAAEKDGYTLSDRGSFLSLSSSRKLPLVMLIAGDTALFNQYGVIPVNPAKFPHVKFKEAKEFADWLISPEGQNLIAAYKDKNGHQLFIPNAGGKTK
ncbi:MAG: extracellular solute-binding protein [Deltaproteobacteria bacterium]|nr:extracellular solute-binding protein [Deltaproteobacteria bacterium]